MVLLFFVDVALEVSYWTLKKTLGLAYYGTAWGYRKLVGATPEEPEQPSMERLAQIQRELDELKALQTASNRRSDHHRLSI